MNSLTIVEIESIVFKEVVFVTLSKTDIHKYKKLYLQTARNYVENMQEYISFLLKGEQTPNAIKQVHIDAHSLKSQSQLMGYENIAKISELIEHLFNKQGDENAEIDHGILIRIQSDLARLTDSFNEIESSEKEIDLADRITELEKLVNIE